MLIDELKAALARSEKREWRKFGVTMGVFFGLIAGLLFWKQSSNAVIIGYIAAAFVLVGLALPILLKPIYVVWMAFATVLGFVMSRVILTLMYTLVFTPVGLVTRILGKDMLNEKIDAA